MKFYKVFFAMLILAAGISLFSVITKDVPEPDTETTPVNPVEIIENPVYYTFEEIQNMKAYSELDEEKLNENLIEELFYAKEISNEIRARIMHISYKENDNISLEELRYLRVLHRGFDGEIRIGELIVNESIADKILSIMKELYANDYQIERMVLVDEYDADDNASMEANNTSAFNYRLKTSGNGLSNHSYGLSIDINPLYNPYVKEKSNGSLMIEPESGAAYADRSKEFPHKLTSDDLCVKLFKKHGFTWSGNWRSSKDYQHFEY